MPASNLSTPGRVEKMRLELLSGWWVGWPREKMLGLSSEKERWKVSLGCRHGLEPVPMVGSGAADKRETRSLPSRLSV